MFKKEDGKTTIPRNRLPKGSRSKRGKKEDSIYLKKITDLYTIIRSVI
jgi:hypothetical protein